MKTESATRTKRCRCLASIDLLPVEILHRILDNLHCETIFLSFSNVCRRFRAVTKTYERCRIDLRGISKTNFHQICRLIQPENVISLTVSNDGKTPGQIDLFLRSSNLRQFIRLRHLTLLQIDSNEQRKILQYVKSLPLLSLTIEVERKATITTARMISSAITESSLSMINLQMKGNVLNQVIWPTRCSLKHLQLHICTSHHYQVILRQLPALETLIIDKYQGRSVGQTPLINHRRLRALTINTSALPTNILKSVLSFTPRLRHLKLFRSQFGNKTLPDGALWQDFIQKTLSELDRFEFSFITRCGLPGTGVDVEKVIEPFQSPFWLEDKRWFVCCEYGRDPCDRIHLYTIPFCDTCFQYYAPLRTIVSNPENPSTNIMDRVDTLDVYSTETSEFHNSIINDADPSILFKSATHANLGIDGLQPLRSVEFLRNLVDLGQLQHISIRLVTCSTPDSYVIDNLGILLERTYNLQSLDIQKFGMYGNYSEILKPLCTILPKMIRHFEANVYSVEDMKEIFQQLRHLSSLTLRSCHWEYPKMFKSFQDWLKEQGVELQQRITPNQLHLWIGKRSRKCEEMFNPNKRIKLEPVDQEI